MLFLLKLDYEKCVFTLILDIFGQKRCIAQKSFFLQEIQKNYLTQFSSFEFGFKHLLFTIFEISLLKKISCQ